MMITLSLAFEKEKSSYDDGKCLMAQIIESHIDTSIDSVGTHHADPSQAVANLKTK